MDQDHHYGHSTHRIYRNLCKHPERRYKSMPTRFQRTRGSILPNLSKEMEKENETSHFYFGATGSAT